MSALCLSNQIKTLQENYYLFYKSTRNELIAVRFPNKEFINLTSLLNAPLCPTNYYVCYGKAYTSIHIIYFDNEGKLIQISKAQEKENNFKWKLNTTTWASIENLPRGKGVPVMLPNNGHNKYIFFSTSSHEVIMIKKGKTSDWKWTLTNLTQTVGAPHCHGNVLFTVRRSPDVTSKHVVYKGENGSLIELYNGRFSEFQWRVYNNTSCPKIDDISPQHNKISMIPDAAMLPWNDISQDTFWVNSNQIMHISIPGENGYKLINLSESLSLPACFSAVYAYRNGNYDLLYYFDDQNRLVELYRKNSEESVGDWNVNQFHLWDEFQDMPRVSGVLLMVPNTNCQQLFWINDNQLNQMYFGENTNWKWTFNHISNLSVINDNNENRNNANENLYDVCCICLVGERSHVVVPCGHKCLCGDCAVPKWFNLFKFKCPICCQPFKDVIKVYE